MAKSLRSKRMRKNRAVKRVKNAKVEMDRLKKALIKDPTTISSDLVTLTKPTSSTTEKSAGKKTQDDDMKGSSESEVELIPVTKEKGETRTFHSKTMKDQYGQYPVWMHPRKIKAIKNKHKKTDKPHSIKKKTIRRKSKKRNKS